MALVKGLRNMFELHHLEGEKSHDVAPSSSDKGPNIFYSAAATEPEMIIPVG